MTATCNKPSHLIDHICCLFPQCSPIRPGHHALQEGEDTLQAHPTKPAPETLEADEMLSNRPLPDPTQQPRTDLPETPYGPGAASMPPGLRTPAGGSDGPPGLTENQVRNIQIKTEIS